MAVGVLVAGYFLYVTRNREDGKRPAVPASDAIALTSATKPDAMKEDTPPPSPTDPPDWTPPEAYYEAAIVTALSEKDLAKYLAPKALAALVVPAHCGDVATCDAVRAFVANPEHTKPEIMTAERWTLPPADRIATATPDLTLAERMRVQTLHHVFVVRIGGTKGDDHAAQLVARAGFAVSAALAEATQGFVYDEVRQRIETPALARKGCITSKLGAVIDPAPQLALQALPRSAGTPDAGALSFRLTSHGMKRFGAPDLEVLCTEEELGAAGSIMNTLAAALVKDPTPRRELVVQAQSKNVRVTFERAPLAEAQPLSTVLRVVLPTGTLGGAPMPGVPAGAWTDAATEDERKSARDAIERATKNGSVRGLLVRADFGSDAGVEAMWVELTGREGDVCTGILRSHPTMATHLQYGESLQIPIRTIDKVHGAPAQQ